MTFRDYRTRERPEPDLEGSWGLWSVSEQRWIDFVVATEREAFAMLRLLRKRDRHEG